MKKIITPVLLLSLSFSTIFPVSNAEAATKLALSSSKVSMKVGATRTVKANKSVKWKSTNKKIATVKKLSAKKAQIKAKKAGTCKIKAIAGKKTAVIRVTVKKVANKPNVTVTPVVTTSPNVPNSEITVRPEATATVSQETMKPEATEAATQETVRPEVTAVVGQETNGPQSTPTIGQETNGPQSTPTIGQETNGPQSTPTIGQETNRPQSTPTIGQETNGPQSTPTVGSETTSPEPSSTVTADAITVSAEGIRMTFNNYENGNISYTIENQGMDDVEYRYGYSLEKEVNGKWVSINPDRNIAVPDVIETIKVGEKREYAENLKGAYDLDSGKYRFSKIIYHKTVKGLVILNLPFEVKDTVVSAEGIRMTLNSYENGNISYTIENQGMDDVEYRYGYSLEKEVDGKWVSINPDRDIAVPAVLETLKIGEKREFTENLKDVYDLDSGKYRFSKIIYHKTVKGLVTLKVPFEVTNAIVSKSGVSITCNKAENDIINYTIENHSGRPISYSYIYLEKLTSNGVRMIADLYLDDKGEIAAGETKENKVDILSLGTGHYYYGIKITVQDTNETFTLELPVEATTTENK